MKVIATIGRGTYLLKDVAQAEQLLKILSEATPVRELLDGNYNKHLTEADCIDDISMSLTNKGLISAELAAELDAEAEVRSAERRKQRLAENKELQEVI